MRSFAEDNDIWTSKNSSLLAPVGTMSIYFNGGWLLADYTLVHVIQIKRFRLIEKSTNTWIKSKSTNNQ
jgi:hypothetical protein